MRQALDLKPLGFIDILSRAFSLYRSNFALVFGLYQLLYVPLALGGIFALYTLLPNREIDDSQQVVWDMLGWMWSMLLAFGFAGPALIFLMSRVYMGGERSVAMGFQALTRRLGHIAHAFFLFAPFISILGLGLLGVQYGIESSRRGENVLYGMLQFLIVLPLNFYIYSLFGFTAAIVMLEDVRAPMAFRRAKILMRGYRWRFFWLNVSCAICVMILNIPAELIGSVLDDESQALFGVIAREWWWSLVTPLFATLCAVFYFDVRSRHEAFDVAVLAQSFGVDPEAIPALKRTSDGAFRMAAYIPEGYQDASTRADVEEGAAETRIPKVAGEA